MFDIGTFSMVLKRQCETLTLEIIQTWEVALGVWAASVRNKESDEWPTTIFYFDSRELKKRDKDSGEQYMAHEIQLLMLSGFTISMLSDSPDDNVSIAYFEGDDPIGNDPANIINYASQLFAKQDNGEVDWPDLAKPVVIKELCTK